MMADRPGEVIHRRFEIKGAHGEPLRGDVRVSRGTDRRPVAVLCHGFKGFKDHGFFPWFCEELARAGFVSVIFNFSHNGVGASLFEFDELDKFKANTFSLEEQDLRLVIDAICDEALPEGHRMDAERISLIGHSRGGAIALSVSSNDSRVRALVTLASISGFSPLATEEIAKWRRDGVRYVLNTRTKQQLPLGVALLEERLARSDMVQFAASQLHVPLLIVHGDQDESVPTEAAYDIKRWAGHAELLIIPGAGHTFGARHPFNGPTPELEQMKAATAKFLSLGKQAISYSSA